MNTYICTYFSLHESDCKPEIWGHPIRNCCQVRVYASNPELLPAMCLSNPELRPAMCLSNPELPPAMCLSNLKLPPAMCLPNPKLSSGMCLSNCCQVWVYMSNQERPPAMCLSNPELPLAMCVCCAPSMQPPQRMHIVSVMKQCSGYELAVIVMNPLWALPLTSHHNNKDVYKGARL